MIRCDYDFDAGSQIEVSSQSTLATCLEHCSDHNRANPPSVCLGVTLYQSYCYLKADTVNGHTQANVESGILITSNATSLSASCPTDDGKNYTDPDGDEFLVRCNYDFSPGKDIDASNQPNFAACLERCSEYNRGTQQVSCRGANFAVASSTCYLKNDISGPFVHQNLDSGILLRSNFTTTDTCSNRTIYQDSDGDSYTVICNYNFYAGQNLDTTSQPDLDHCLDRCSVYNAAGPSSRCAGVNFQRSTSYCFLKAKTINSYSDYNVDSGLLIPAANVTSTISAASSTSASLSPTSSAIISSSINTTSTTSAPVDESTMIPYIIYIWGPAPSRYKRRQENYRQFAPTNDNAVSSDYTCREAAKFELDNGALYNGHLQVSAEYNALYTLMAGSADVGKITGIFSYVNETLVWKNNRFKGGQATFCEVISGDNAGDIFAVFASPPPNCEPIIISTKSCRG